MYGNKLNKELDVRLHEMSPNHMRFDAITPYMFALSTAGCYNILTIKLSFEASRNNATPMPCVIVTVNTQIPSNEVHEQVFKSLCWRLANQAVATWGIASGLRFTQRTRNGYQFNLSAPLIDLLRDKIKITQISVRAGAVTWNDLTIATVHFPTGKARLQTSRTITDGMAAKYIADEARKLMRDVKDELEEDVYDRLYALTEYPYIEEAPTNDRIIELDSEKEFIYRTLGHGRRAYYRENLELEKPCVRYVSINGRVYHAIETKYWIILDSNAYPVTKNEVDTIGYFGIDRLITMVARAMELKNENQERTFKHQRPLRRSSVMAL